MWDDCSWHKLLILMGIFSVLRRLRTYLMWSVFALPVGSVCLPLTNLF